VRKKVLVVEPNLFYISRWHREFKGNNLVLITALGKEDAENQFGANPDVDAIVVDACVPNTLYLVRGFKGAFDGPIIAISGVGVSRKALLKAGCDRECRRENLTKFLLALLL
jgi:hypothetical protein